MTGWTAAELSQRLAKREVSCREVAEAYLARISALDSTYNCYLTVSEEVALAAAEEAQARFDRQEAGPLCGIPIALKDVLSTKGIRTTCASKMLDGYVPAYDATVVDRIRKHGMVPLGKTNLDEFAMGASTENSAFGPTRNPWDPTCSPGGSSGGSAAAVAARLAPVALGTDTGGSIRQPASLCGVVGFKPTYGRVSRYGLVAFASSLDQIGPFGRTVEDVALVVEAISGHDPRDSTSLTLPPIDRSTLKEGVLKGKRIALPDELWVESHDRGILETCRAAVEVLRQAGAEIEEISLPSIRYGVTTYYIIAPAEASSNLARFDGIRYGYHSEAGNHVERVAASRGEGFGHEVKTRIMIGTYALSAGYYDAYYVRAQQVRRQMRQEFEEAFGRFDFIVSPTSPVPAFPLGSLRDNPMALKLLDYCTIPANLGGFPALSMPCGLTGGLPVGLQIVGAPLADECVLQTADALERLLGVSPPPPIA